MSGIRLGKDPKISDPERRAFVHAFRQLLRHAPFSSLDALGARLPRKLDRRRMSDLATGNRLPDASDLAAIIAACRRPERELRKLQGLLRRAEDEEYAKAAGRIPHEFRLARHAVAAGERLPTVEEFRDWDRLGVHRPITRLSSGQDLSERLLKGELPAYMEREKDRTELRPALAKVAAGDGPVVRLVLVTGASLAGKTRAAVEAMRAALPTWRLLIPRSAHGLAELLNAEFDLRRTVVWLNEIQELVVQESGAEQLERLLELEAGPTVLLATLRADAEDPLRGTAGGRLLRRATPRITMQRRPPRAELERELARARELDDPWLADALDKIGDRYGIAEWLAAGPQLADQLERARASDDPVKQTAAAFVDAAIGCYRAGYTQPIPEPLLLAGHRLYLPEHVRHTTQPVIAEALEWARKPVAGASPLLEEHRGWGYKAFDYLLARGDTGMPEVAVEPDLWRLLSKWVTPGTIQPVARAAFRAGRQALTLTLIRRLPEDELVPFYEEIGGRAALTALADAGNAHAEGRLAQLLADDGDLEELATRADNNLQARLLLSEVEADREPDDLEDLTARADAGDRSAAGPLARLLAQRGDIEALTARADAGNRPAAEQLADLLAERGDIEALTSAANDEWYARKRLAELLTERRDTDALTTRADNGDLAAAMQLAKMLASRGDVESLSARADAGDNSAASALARLLAERGDAEALAARADAGDMHAAERLGELLVIRGDVKALIARIDRGDEATGQQLANLLVRSGDIATLTERADGGDRWAALKLADLLAERDDIDGLTARANAGDQFAEVALTALLVDREDVDALAARANAGNETAAWELTQMRAPGRGDDKDASE
jgi:hypothetical protein